MVVLLQNNIWKRNQKHEATKHFPPKWKLEENDVPWLKQDERVELDQNIEQSNDCNDRNTEPEMPDRLTLDWNFMHCYSFHQIKGFTGFKWLWLKLSKLRNV